MLVTKPYERMRAVEYARKWAFSQNPLFSSFKGIGGNCTNFVSQCVYAGTCRMNYRPTFGWYYVSLNNRAPAWTGVEFFYNFLTSNLGVGPFGEEISPDALELGDVIQLGRNEGGFYHTLLVVGFEGDDILVSAQTDDAYNRPLSTYTYDYARYIKILGARFVVPDPKDCFQSVFDGIAILHDVGTLEGEVEEAPPLPSDPMPSEEEEST